jgi:MoaA/NifB/PqqE/SkfB family radical SAM enzyme
MEQTPRKDNIRYSILTNGLMFKEFHDKIPHIMNGLTTLGISIDGATADTYEKLRLGGKWDKLIESLESVTEAKRRHGFGLHWHMVVQQDNWQEMPAMLALAYKHEVDRVFFNRIQDWNTGLDFEKQKFHDLDEFKELRHIVTRDPISSTFGLF